ncbi:hypothetical protein FZEAL_9265 [Fusarium zealandicum]|uniref:Acyl-CoA thioesterase n=1 Tax=Fusarium zealandicum TaxID=1053134 RepID=A0A8H4UCY0_9HYPO|nr:hypothetical protein FZEAL_9265 [Fusarium zealandicum]
MASRSALADQVAVEQLGPGEYVSKLLPMRMGNSMPIAYGGCATSLAVSAACATAPPNMALYSVLGHFHGPASTDRKLYCSVSNTRDTRSFVTRRVQVKQKQPDGKLRVCLELIADFHIKEPSLFVYSEPPSSKWPQPMDCPDMQTQISSLLADGVITKEQGEEYAKSFGINDQFFETRYCMEGVAGQNISGAAKATVTTQDHRHITDKISAEWQRAKQPLHLPAENLGALSFLMDGGLSFLPLTHNHMWFDDVTACSTLDFALRVFVPDVKLCDWHLRERKTSRASNGRSFAEGKLWDEQGNLVASVSQQSIMRLKKQVPLSKLS